MTGARTTIISHPVVIQDIVVASYRNQNSKPSFATGEFGKPELFGGSIIPDNENPAILIDRLYQQIAHFVSAASVQHRQNFSADLQLLPDRKNHITRLLTNEFFFYTKMPLTLAQFETLIQKIISLAKTEPINFHLLLGSFSVLTPDNKVMNVVPKIECGLNPKIDLVVKSTPSNIDPVYYERNTIGIAIHLPNIKRSDNISNFSIKIDNKPVKFEFNNVFICKTADNEFFHSCIDICLDHAKGVAKKTLNMRLETAIYHAEKGRVNPKIPIQCSHAVLSNYIYLYPPLCVGDMTHADPHYSHHASKIGVPIVSNTRINQISFGTPADIVVMSPAQCNSLNHSELLQANYHNELQNFIANYKGESSQLAYEIGKQFSNYKATINKYMLLDRHKINLCNRIVKCTADQPKSNQSSIIKAVINGDLQIITNLVNGIKNANINLTPEGDSLLMLAIIYQQIPIINFLLNNGANLLLKNIDGQTAMSFAEGDILKLMLDFAVNKSIPPTPVKTGLNNEDCKLVKDLYIKHRVDYYELFNKTAKLLGYDAIDRNSDINEFEKIYQNAITPGKHLPVGLLNALKIAYEVLSNPFKKIEYDKQASSLHDEAIVEMLTNATPLSDLKKHIDNWVKDIKDQTSRNQFWKLFFKHVGDDIRKSIKNSGLSSFLNPLQLTDTNKVNFMLTLGKPFILELIKEKGLANFLSDLNIDSSLQIDLIKKLGIKNLEITEILKAIPIEIRGNLLKDPEFTRAIETANIHLLPHYFEENLEARKVAHEIIMVAYLKKMMNEYQQYIPKTNMGALNKLMRILNAEIINPFKDYSNILLGFKNTFEATKSQLLFDDASIKNIISKIESAVDNSILSVSMFKQPTENTKAKILPSSEKSKQPKQ